MAKYDHIDFTPPQGVRKEAARALEWRREFGRGGTAVGVARARDLSRGVKISPDTAKRMASFFARHEGGKDRPGFKPGQDGFPSAARIAWALWGGDAGKSWASKLTSQMEAADKRRSVAMKKMTKRSRVVCSTSKKKRSTAPAAESRSLAVERRSLVLGNDADGQQTLCVESRCEHREEDGTETKRDYIVGYAAKFGVTSLDLGKFTERIAPSAFGLVSERRGRKKTLETRALFNHNADMPLAKYPGTLKLSVDDVGLRYEFPVPDTSYGRDLAANIRDGIVTGSSFSFTVPKDGESWSVEDGKSVRTVTRVDSLIDVGPVTYPAYPDTDTRVARRSYDHFRKSSEARTARRQRLKLVASRAAAEIKRFLAKHGR